VDPTPYSDRGSAESNLRGGPHVRHRGSNLIEEARFGGNFLPHSLFQTLVYLLLIVALAAAVFLAWNWSSLQW
jgi:hypothetical protein